MRDRLDTPQLDAIGMFISGFIDAWLDVQEEQVFQTEVVTLEGKEREGIMQIVTS
jgi:hypothetical protein